MRDQRSKTSVKLAGHESPAVEDVTEEERLRRELQMEALREATVGELTNLSEELTDEQIKEFELLDPYDKALTNVGYINNVVAEMPSFRSYMTESEQVLTIGDAPKRGTRSEIRFSAEDGLHEVPFRASYGRYGWAGDSPLPIEQLTVETLERKHTYEDNRAILKLAVQTPASIVEGFRSQINPETKIEKLAKKVLRFLQRG